MQRGLRSRRAQPTGGVPQRPGAGGRVAGFVGLKRLNLGFRVQGLGPQGLGFRGLGFRV